MNTTLRHGIEEDIRLRIGQVHPGARVEVREPSLVAVVAVGLEPSEFRRYLDEAANEGLELGFRRCLRSRSFRLARDRARSWVVRASAF